MGTEQNQTNIGTENYVEGALGENELLRFNNLQQLQNGIAHYNSGNYNAAYAIFNDLSQKGNPEAEYYLSQFFSKGLGVPSDQNRSYFWLKKSADHKYAPAQYSYAIFLMTNRPGTDPLFHEGMKYMAKAADQNMQMALKSYVDIVLMGYYEPDAIKKAIGYFAKLQPVQSDRYEVETYKNKEEKLKVLLVAAKRRKFDGKVMKVLGILSPLLLVLGYLYFLGGTHPSEWRENVLLKIFPDAPDRMVVPFHAFWILILAKISVNGKVGLEILTVAYTLRSLYAVNQKIKLKGSLSTVSKLIAATFVVWHVLLVIIEGTTLLEGIIYFVAAILVCRIVGLILGRLINTIRNSQSVVQGIIFIVIVIVAMVGLNILTLWIINGQIKA